MEPRAWARKYVVIAVALDGVGSETINRIKIIILSSKKHHIVSQLLLDKSVIILVKRAVVVARGKREDKGIRSRGMNIAVSLN